MTNDELKKKIVEILCKVWVEPVPCTAERKFEHAADALIAAGLKFDTVVSHTATFDIMQQYQISRLEIQVAEAEHRAEVAERALRRSISFLTCRACQAFLYGPCDTDACGDERCINNFLKQAEEALAEGRKDEQD